MHSQLDRPQPYNPDAGRGEYQNAYDHGMVNEAPGAQSKARLIDDNESEISDTTNCEWVRNILTVYGFWAFCGGVYWGIGTIWGWFYLDQDKQLYTWVFFMGIAAGFTILWVFLGVVRGAELGHPESIKWVLPYCMVVMLNIWIHTYFARQRSERNLSGLAYSAAFIVCDWISLLYISAVFYGFLTNETNRKFRIKNFVFEWCDLLSQIAVTIIYNDKSKAVNSDTYTNLFWGFILVQLFLWVLPILFGAGTHKTYCRRQLFVLDFLTDFPLLILNFASGGYAVNFWIVVDSLIKMAFMIRSSWQFLHNEYEEFKEQPCQIICFMPFCGCDCCDLD